MLQDVTRFLDEAGIDFDVLAHTHKERAADEAAALGIEPEEVAKTLVLVTSSGNARAWGSETRFVPGERRQLVAR